MGVLGSTLLALSCEQLPNILRLSNQSFKMEEVGVFSLFVFAVDEEMGVRHPAWSSVFRADLVKKPVCRWGSNS